MNKVKNIFSAVVLLVLAIITAVVVLPFGAIHLIARGIYRLVVAVMLNIVVGIMGILLGEVPEEIQVSLDKISKKGKESNGEEKQD